MKIKIADNKLILVSVRSPRGAMLMELLVAITVSGLLAVSLCQSLSLTKEASFGAHGRVICASIAQEIAERLRDTPFETLPTIFPAIVPIQVYSTPTDPPVTSFGYSFQQPALMMDSDPTKYTWGSSTTADKFPIDSTVTFTAGPFPDSVTANIAVSAPNVHSSYALNILLTHYGIQRNEN